MNRRARIIKLAMALNPTHFLEGAYREAVHGTHADRAAKLLGMRNSEKVDALNFLSDRMRVVNSALNADVNAEPLAEIIKKHGSNVYGATSVDGANTRIALALGDVPAGWGKTTKEQAHIKTFYTKDMGELAEEAEDRIAGRPGARKVPIQEFVDRYLAATGKRTKGGGWHMP